jgi:hypothetical protein
MWTLECAARWEGAKTPEELGLRLVSRSRVSRAPDELRLETAEDPAAASLLRWKDWVVVRRDGVGFFAGSVTATPLSAAPNSEGRGYTVSGPWWWLSQVACHAAWNDGNSGTATKPGVIFEHTIDIDGTPTAQTTADHIEDTITAAIASGVPIQLGSIFTGIRTLRYQATGTTYADALDTILRHHADAVTWFDYSTEVDGEIVPTFHASRRVSADAVTLPFEGGDLSAVSLRKRDDLVPDRIRIGGWFSNRLTGPAWDAGTIDLVENPPPPIRELVIDVGSKQIRPGGDNGISFLAQRIRTRPIPQTAAAETAKDWWVDHIEILAAVKDDLNLANVHIVAANANVQLPGGKLDAVTAHSVAFAGAGPEPPARINPEAIPPLPEGPGGYPNELLEGTIEDWMNHSAIRLTVTASVAMTVASVEALAANLKLAVKTALPRQALIGGTWYYFNTFTIEVTGTDASTATHRVPASITAAYEAASPSAEGRSLNDLVADFAATLTPTPFDGRWELTEVEPGAADYIGKVLNVSGGHADWATMRAQIQIEEVDVETGVTTLTLGAPHHAGFFSDLSDANNSLPVTLDYTYDHTPDSEHDGAAVGGYALPRDVRGKEDVPQWPSGPAALSPVHLYWDGNTAKVVWSAAVMPEINPEYQRAHPILIGEDAIDGETAFTAPTGTSGWWLLWETTSRGVISGSVTLTSTEPTGDFQDFLPDSPDGSAVEGRYKLKVYTLEAPGPGQPFSAYPEAPIPVWQRHAWDGVNIGDDGEGIFAEATATQRKWRKIAGNDIEEASSETEIRTAVETAEAGNLVVRAFLVSEGANVNQLIAFGHLDFTSDGTVYEYNIEDEHMYYFRSGKLVGIGLMVDGTPDWSPDDPEGLNVSEPPTIFSCSVFIAPPP